MPLLLIERGLVLGVPFFILSNQISLGYYYCTYGEATYCKREDRVAVVFVVAVVVLIVVADVVIDAAVAVLIVVAAVSGFFFCQKQSCDALVQTEKKGN